jgi:hypothetical protein
MNDCYLNFLVSFRALFSLDVGANLVNSKQTIGIILPDLSFVSAVLRTHCVRCVRHKTMHIH